MNRDLKKLNLQAMLFAAGVACGYVLGSLWPGFFFLMFIPFGFFPGRRPDGKITEWLAYLLAAGVGLTAGFLASLLVWITSL
jgi:hypothetical protein